MQQQLPSCLCPIKSQLIIFLLYLLPFLSLFLSFLSLPFPKQITANAINHPYHNRSRSGRSCTIQHILHHRAQCRRGYWTSQVIYCKLFPLTPYTCMPAISIPCIILPTSTLRAVQPNCMIRPLHQGNDVLHMVRIVMEPIQRPHD